MLLAFADINYTIVLGIVLAVAVLGAFSLLINTIIISRKKKINNASQSDNQIEESTNTVQQEQAYLEANEQGVIVMSRNVIYSAGIDGQISPGKYRMQSADGSTERFNVRINGLVREYENGDFVTLSDGDTVSPVSGAVQLCSCEE